MEVAYYTLQHILIHFIYRTISTNIIQVQCIPLFPICENSLPHSFPPSNILSHPLVEHVVGVAHSVDVRTQQAMLTEHPELDITPTTEGGVTPSLEQVGGVTHPSLMIEVCY